MNEQRMAEVEVEEKDETAEERPARLTVEVPTDLKAGGGAPAMHHHCCGCCH